MAFPASWRPRGNNLELYPSTGLTAGMFNIEEVKKRVTGDIRKLNSRLLEVSKQLERDLSGHEICSTPPGLITHAFFRKAVRTFEAIELLKRQHLYEESWVLLRVLLETHVNLLYFLLTILSKCQGVTTKPQFSTN